MEKDANEPSKNLKELSNVSLEESGSTHGEFLFMVLFICLFILFYIAGGFLGIDRSSELFIGGLLGISMLLAAIIYKR